MPLFGIMFAPGSLTFTYLFSGLQNVPFCVLDRQTRLIGQFRWSSLIHDNNVLFMTSKTWREHVSALATLAIHCIFSPSELNSQKNSAWCIFIAKQSAQCHSGWRLSSGEARDCFHNRYWIIHRLSHGTCSTIWLASDERSDTHVAVKICISNLLEINVQSKYRDLHR